MNEQSHIVMSYKLFIVAYLIVYEFVNINEYIFSVWF